MPALDETHDPDRTSWIASANRRGAEFPIQNLPFGAFSDGGGPVRIGTAIGDRILDLTRLEAQGILRPSPGASVFDRGVLNPFMALGPKVWTRTRRAIADLLDAKARTRAPEDALVPISAVRMHRAIAIGGFTDFYASREHATTVGAMFRDPENALPPNWLHMPIGYNGRASTVVVSGTDIRRPCGQLKGAGDRNPRLGPSARLDFELELGAVVGQGNPMGQPVSPAQAREMIFGYALLNDWSARDIQVWEYQPLGPFLSKAFATTMGAWIVTRDALEPFRVPAPYREVPLLPYLDETGPGNIDLSLEVDLAPVGSDPVTICRTNQRYLYYTPAQQLAHHTLSGCAMEVGDLLGSGTISGPDPGSAGSLLELTYNGQEPLEIGGASRGFLEDGDEVILRGWCEGVYRVGFGECRGRVVPAP